MGYNIKFKRAIVQFSFYCGDQYTESYIEVQLVGMIHSAHMFYRNELGFCKIMPTYGKNEEHVIRVQTDLCYKEFKKIVGVLNRLYPMNFYYNVVRFL